MRPEVALAERRAEVREAARGWHRAGLVDDAALAAIDAAYSDDRSRVGPVFRVLLFIFTVVAVNAGFGLALVLFAEAGDGETVAQVLTLLTGAALVVATEVQVGPLRRAQGGSEAATGLLAQAFLLGGLGWVLFEAVSAGAALLGLVALTVLICAAAAWRWGAWLSAVAATAAVLVLLARLPAGRLFWVVAGAVLSGLLLHLADSGRLAPSQRRAAMASAAAFVAGVYVAVHLGSYDAGLVEMVGALPAFLQSVRPPSSWRPLAIAGTALLPLVLLALGVRTRRRSLLLLGFAALVASVWTFFAYTGALAPWAGLTVCGAAAVGAALALRRFLDTGPQHERGGFTAEPVFIDPERQGALEAVAAAVVLQPDARQPAEEPGFKGEGGEFGGGGASSGF